MRAAEEKDRRMTEEEKEGKASDTPPKTNRRKTPK
jgi:hypothetical protein